jgi:hypothetical protein
MADATITPVTTFTSLQVYDLDFSTGNQCTIKHSFNSEHLFISFIALLNSGQPMPAIVPIDNNSFTVQGTVDNSKLRVYVTVIPSQ